MKRRRLGRSGPEISVIGVGAWAAGGDELVGRAIAQLPSSERPMVFTKCSRVWGEDGAVRSDLSPASLRRECEASLTRLGLDQIDLYQIHQPAPEPDLEQGWEALIGLQEEGKVRHLGVSNFTVGQLERLRSIAAPVSLQPSYSLIDRNVEEALLPYCRSNGVGVIVCGSSTHSSASGTTTSGYIARTPRGRRGSATSPGTRRGSCSTLEGNELKRRDDSSTRAMSFPPGGGRIR